MSDRRNSLRLPINVVEPFPLDHAVLESGSDDSKIEKLGNVRAQLAIIVAISAFEVHGHRHVNCRRDPFDDLLGKRKWKVLAVLISLRTGDRPTAGRDRRRAGIDDRFRTACIPRVVKYQWRPFDVKGGELFSFLGLAHSHPPVQRLLNGEIADRPGVEALLAHAAGVTRRAALSGGSPSAATRH